MRGLVGDYSEGYTRIDLIKYFHYWPCCTHTQNKIVVTKTCWWRSTVRHCYVGGLECHKNCIILRSRVEEIGWRVSRMRGWSLRDYQGFQITFGSLVSGETLAGCCFFSSASIADLNLMSLLFSVLSYLLMKAVPWMPESWQFIKN